MKYTVNLTATIHTKAPSKDEAQKMLDDMKREIAAIFDRVSSLWSIHLDAAPTKDVAPTKRS